MECAVVELRQYTLHPGARDTLIELFDREFVHTQEAAGIRVMGQFRDLDDPDRFVWLRGFPDMESRRRSLEAFYGGPVWSAHRDAANATMIDSDDVRLLRPTSALPLPWSSNGTEIGGYMIVIAPASEGSFCAGSAAGFAGGVRVASFVTEASANTFPALPVRLGEDVVVDVYRVRAMPSRRAVTDEPWVPSGAAVLRLADRGLGPALSAVVARP